MDFLKNYNELNNKNNTSKPETIPYIEGMGELRYYSDLNPNLNIILSTRLTEIRTSVPEFSEIDISKKKQKQGNKRLL